VEHYVARQPILDSDQRVYAYELLFRGGPENVFNHSDFDEASSRVIGEGAFGFGLDALVGEGLAFVNVTREVLLRDTITLLPPKQTVVELLETVEPDEDVVAMCRRLKASGYLIALDDFVPGVAMEPLVEVADILKIDFLVMRGPERREIAAAYAPRGIRMLAEKVETHLDFQDAVRAGYAYFQGYFFAKPIVEVRHDIPALKITYLRLLKEVNQPQLTFEGLEEIIKHDVSLSMKLLKYLNSAGFGWRHEIKSIRQALTLLGERPIRKWVSLVALSSLAGGKPAELIVTSLMRARLCESLAQHTGLRDSELDLFLTGLLSAVDALVDRPLAEVLHEMALPEQVRRTLMGEPSKLQDVYKLVLSYERGDWEETWSLMGRMDLGEDLLPGLYRQAVTFAHQLQKI